MGATSQTLPSRRSIGSRSLPGPGIAKLSEPRCVFFRPCHRHHVVYATTRSLTISSSTDFRDRRYSFPSVSTLAGCNLVEAGRERCILRAFHDREVFLFFEVAQIAFGREITERIEGHGLASRRYLT